MIAPCKTRSGRIVDLAAPDWRAIRLGDVAAGLAALPRYSAGAPRPISVAEHSLNLARRVPLRLRLAALLHDAHEALLGDVTRPAALAIENAMHDIGGPTASGLFRQALFVAKGRLDRAIAYAVVADAGVIEAWRVGAGLALYARMYDAELLACDEAEGRAELAACWAGAPGDAPPAEAIALQWLVETRDAARSFVDENGGEA
jgi:hypothetical protein